MNAHEDSSSCGDDQIVIRTTESKLKEAEKKILGIQNLNEVPPSLGCLTMAAATAQLVQSMFLFILASRDIATYFLFTNYPSVADPQIPDPNAIAKFSILWYAPVGVLLSGLEHTFCLVFRQHYVYYIERSQNPYRWFEYSFSASILRVMLAQLCGTCFVSRCTAKKPDSRLFIHPGVTDVHLLVCLFVLTAVSIQYAATHETVNAKARADDLPMNWRPFFCGWIGHFATWFVIFNYLTAMNLDGNAPASLVGIVITLFLLELVFVINFSLQWLKVGRWKGT